MMTVVSLEAELTRLRSEFLLFPGLCLTAEQAARLIDVPRGDATQLLATLEDEGLLLRLRNGSYRRASPLFS